MSETHTGGDGSVMWQVQADTVVRHNSNHAEDGAFDHHGVDETGQCGRDWFTVSIEVPEGFSSPEAYLEALKGEGPLGLKIRKGRVYFNLPIQRMHHDQVIVAWGKSDNVFPPDPNVRKKRRSR